MKTLIKKLKNDFPLASNNDILWAATKIDLFLEGFGISESYYSIMYDRMRLIDFKLRSSIFHLVLEDYKTDYDIYLEIVLKMNFYKKELNIPTKKAV